LQSFPSVLSNGEGMEPRGVRPLTAGRWQTLEPLIDQAVALPPARRRAFLDSACSGDDALRAELARLLEDYDRQDTLLDRPAAERFAALFGDLAGLPEVLGGRYRIEREIGRGGTATLYQAQDVRHDRRVAVKILHPTIAAVVGAGRFLAEIRTTAGLHHPHILPLHDSGEADGLLYYVMPYVEGESLRRRMEREPQLPIDEAVRIALEVAAALDSAHRRGVIHRDIKPENILLGDGGALVADFGIALAVSGAAPRLTSPGVAVGTPQYMSPEQAAGDRALDGRVDIYALGTVLYEMLAGEPPFTGATATTVMAKRAVMPAPALGILRPATPAPLAAAVARALAREPADRFHTAGDFAAALRDALPGAGAGALPRSQVRGVGRRLGLTALGLVVIALAIVTSVFVARSRRDAAAGAPDQRNSIAVLPFADLGADTANAFFAEGMTDALSGALGRMPGVRVVSARSAAFLSNGTAVEPRRIGQTLRVATLLEGSVQRASNQLRVVIQLVSTADGSTLWSNQFTRGATTDVAAGDIFAVEDDIVRDVLAHLRITPAGELIVPAVRRPTESLKAYDLYLQGKYFQDQGGPEGHRKALAMFTEAVATDSNFAQALSGLADVYTAYGIGNMGDYQPDEYFPRARAAARRALAIDSASAEAHAAEAKVRLLYDYDWAGAEREFARALALDPHYLMARSYHVVLLEFTARFDSALAEARAALDDDPLSVFVNIEESRALIFARDYDRAIQHLRRLLERDSTYFRAHLLLGQAYEQTGRPDAAVTEMQSAVRLAPKSSRMHAFLAHAYARAGRTDEALHELGLLRERARSGYVPAFDFAVAFVGLNRKDEAFAWLEKALAERSIRPYLMDPTFDPIRSDARFRQLLRKMHLPTEFRTVSMRPEK
jgi:TolB-like protein/tetratricopeptide (TPR) repeat protein